MSMYRMLCAMGAVMVCWADISLAGRDGEGWKIAIIDSGIMRNHPYIRGKIDKQFCWSDKDEKTDDSTNARTGYVHYKVASTCPGGAQSNLTAVDAGTVPRRTAHNFNTVYDYHYFGARHGSTVLDEARFLASKARFIVVNNTYYYHQNKYRDENGDEVTCAYHGPSGEDASFPDDRKPSDLAGCYDPADAEKQTAIMQAIQRRGKVAAINYSASKTESCNNNSAVFKALKKADIAFVASAGNGGPQEAVVYPACNPHVISVGALNADLSLAGITSLQGKIDFFAVGEGIDYLTGAFTPPATSYAAPKVAAAFAVMKSARPLATLAEMKFALGYVAPKCIEHRGGCVPVVTAESIKKAAECLSFRTCKINLPPGSFTDINYDDAGQYGRIYGDTSDNYVLEVDFSAIAANTVSQKTSVSAVSAQAVSAKAVSAKAGITAVSGARDVVLSFDSKMASKSGNGLRIYINNRLYQRTATFLNEQRFEWVVNRRFFKPGNNLIRIEPIHRARDWGISNIKAGFTPVVPLTVGQTDRNEYGYDGAPTRYTGLRATFEVSHTDTDLLLSMVGWDIDTHDETGVLLNGTLLGHLTPGAGSSQYSPKDYFLLNRGLLRKGTNYIEWVQRNTDLSWREYEYEKWAVKDLRVQIARPDLIVPQADIVDRLLKSGIPFAATATIHNVGVGSSQAGVATFYASADATITAVDTPLVSVPVKALPPGARARVSTTMQSTLVNQGYYWGVCIAPVAGETDQTNNCSSGTVFSSRVAMAPVIMLLLE